MRQVDIISGFVALLMSSEPLKTWVCEEENGVVRYNIYGPPIPETEKVKRNNGLIVIDEAGGPGPEEYDSVHFSTGLNVGCMGVVTFPCCQGRPQAGSVRHGFS